MLTYTLKIESIKKETSDAVTVCFKQPGLKKIKYIAGQYLTLMFRINGRRYIRPYSFSSAPGVDNTLNVTVKRVPSGVVSNHIVDRLKIGDMIEVMKPMGDFILDEISPNHTNTHLVLWGSGSGITPLMSIIKYALNLLSYGHITLVYGNRNFESAIFSQEIEQLQKLYPQKFSIWHFHTRSFFDDINSRVILGRIDPEKILHVLSNEGDLKNTIHYICGPDGLKQSVINQLINVGINSDAIFTEDFEVKRDPNAFIDVFTQKVLININNKINTIEVVKGKSILEAALDGLIELSYSCQTGNCLLCRAKIQSGEVKTIGIEKLPDGLSNDECLLCCSFPLTDNVEILIN